MSDDRACPAEREIIEFSQGRALPAAAQRIAQHLSNCPTCSACAAAQNENRSASLEMTRVAPENVETNPPRPDYDESTPALNGGEDFDLGLLSASQQFGSLGRLGNYEILGILGRGGYGIVLRAKDNTLGRQVAIKVLEQSFAGSASSRRRFMREARAAAAVNHSNVVTIHAIEEHNGIPFLVMELVAGKSLRDWIRENPKREFMDILRIGAQVAQGLAAAHAQGVIHRDVKPANIMLEDGVPRVKITDFGLARVAVENVELTSRQIAVGTPAYMAPEQFRGEGVDTRTDLFALGCVLYSMCAGHSPFHGRTVIEVAQLVNNFQPPNLADENPSVPRFLGDMVVRLLEKDPQRRYQSAAEVADVLNRYLTTFNAAPTDEIPRLVRDGMRREKTARFGIKLIYAAVAIASIATAVWISKSNGYRNRSDGGPADTAADSGNRANGSTQRTATIAADKPVAKSASVTVASDGSADFRTITDALAHVLPGGEVVVHDAAEYTEPIFVRDALAYTGVRLISQKRTVLKAPHPGAVVRLQGIPGFQISGFKIVATQGQHALELTGECAGTQIRDVQVDRIDNPDAAASSIAAVYLHQGAAGTAEAPLRFDGLVVRDTIVGLVIGDRAPVDPERVPRHIILENSSIVGIDEASSTLLALYPACRDVQFHHNLLAHGLYGLSILTEGEHKPQAWEFTHNTCYRLSSFMAWAGPAEPVPAFVVAHNLLLDVRYAAEELLAATSLADARERFPNNLWVNPPTEGRERLQRLASFVESLPLLSTDSGHADFLKPDVAHLTSRHRRDPFPGRYGLDK